MIYLASRAPDCVRHVASRARAAVSRGRGRGGRGVSRGRFARARGRRSAGTRRAVALAVLALVLLVPSVARAEVDWEEKTANYTAIVAPYEYSADGRVAAFVEYLGYDWTSLTSDAQSYILEHLVSGTSFGNALHDGSIKNLMYEYREETQWPIVSYWATTFGLPNMWYISLQSGDYNSARVEYDQTLAAWVDENGYGGGGGSSVGGSEIVGDNVVFTMPTYYSYSDNPEGNVSIGNLGPIINGVQYSPFSQIDIDKWNQQTGFNYVQYPDNTTLSVPKSALSKLANFDDYDLIGCAYLSGQSANRYVTVYAFKKGSWSSEVLTYNPGTRYANTSYFVRITTSEPYKLTNVKATYSEPGTLVYANHVDSVYNYSAGVADLPNTTPGTGSGISLPVSGGGSNEPTYPEPPQPPEIPEPDPPETKPIDDPGITLPPINFPDLVLPDIDYTVETPTGTDVIPYLKKIIANQEDIASFLSAAISIIDEDLDNIGKALGEHCNHLQQQLQKQVYWLATELQDMFDVLEQGISNYLYRVQHNLLMGIGWEFDNISMDLISWLKRIYSRLGGTGIGKPDINTDEKGFWDWLMEQFAKFLADLAGKPLDAVDELFDLLKDFFPFSLPWDFYTMLGLLAHDPVTPVFDLPMPVPTVVSSGHTHDIHIDCHAWDDTMFVVRSLEMLFFAFKVFHMVPRWFNFIKVAE